MSKKIKFVSYDGKYPNLCSGILVLEIDNQKIYGKYCLSSGGSAGVDFSGEESEEYCTEGPWEVKFDEFWKNPIDSDDWNFYQNNEKILEDFFSDEDRKKITELVNENVEWGCCGGCI